MNKNEQFVITINREVGTGGRTVGRKLAEKLCVKYCDKAVIDGLTQKFGLTPERIEEIKAQKKSWWNNINNYYQTLVNSASQPMEAEVKLDSTIMFETEKRILQELATHSSCVVAGRSGFFVFRDHPNRLSILIQASMDFRVKRVANKQHITSEEARKIIEKVDKMRENYVNKYTKSSRYDTRNYDLVITADGKTEDEIVDIILRYIGQYKTDSFTYL